MRRTIRGSIAELVPFRCSFIPPLHALKELAVYSQEKAVFLSKGNVLLRRWRGKPLFCEFC